MSRRTDRVAHQVRSEIARILREEATDPRLSLVTVTRVEVSPDLGSARVFWSSLSGDEAEAIARVERALEHATGFIRRELAAVLPLRRAPELRFHHDPSFIRGAEILSVLRSLGDDRTD